MKKYLLHRISHCSDVSYPLLEKGILTIGWQCFVGKGMLDILKTGNKEDFDERATALGEGKNKSRQGLWRFSQMKKGDIIVVILYGRKFGIFEVDENIEEIVSVDLKEFENNDGDKIILSKEKQGLVNTNNDKIIDLGYFLKVKKIKITEKQYADSKLTSKMNTRQTNCSLDEVKDSVEAAIIAEEPYDPYDKILSDIVSKSILDDGSNIFLEFEPMQFQNLVKLYFERIGATRVESLVGNEKSKINPGLGEKCGDVDVVAQFEDLNLVFNVQVKRHDGKTDSWGVRQIREYSEKLSEKISEDAVDETIHISWVVSSAEFSEKAIIEAEQANIRLIGGKEFLRMLLRAGFAKMDVNA